MKSNPHGVIVKVENLDICRSFYRDVLGLGNPVMDSNFWVEFRVDEKLSLFLEKIEDGEKLSIKKGRISWMYHVENLEQMILKLNKEGCEPFQDNEQEKIGFKVAKFCDPEGNFFYIYS